MLWGGEGKIMDAKKDKISVEADAVDEEFISEQFADEFVAEDESVEEQKEKRRVDKSRLLESIKGALSYIFVAAMWTVISFVLGRAELPFGSVFLGIALLCAASSKLGYIYLGLSLGAILGGEGAVV